MDTSLGTFWGFQSPNGLTYGHLLRCPPRFRPKRDVHPLYHHHHLFFNKVVGLFKIETSTQIFPVNFVKNFMNSFFRERLWYVLWYIRYIFSLAWRWRFTENGLTHLLSIYSKTSYLPKQGRHHWRLYSKAYNLTSMEKLVSKMLRRHDQISFYTPFFLC